MWPTAAGRGSPSRRRCGAQVGPDHCLKVPVHKFTFMRKIKNIIFSVFFIRSIFAFTSRLIIFIIGSGYFYLFAGTVKSSLIFQKLPKWQ